MRLLQFTATAARRFDFAGAPLTQDDIAIANVQFQRTHRHHIWQADQKTFKVPEFWSSLADEVELGEIFYGDCDNFALTSVDLCLRQGIDPSKLWIATCWTELPTREYHAVGGVGNIVLDNRQRRLLQVNDLGYKWHRAMRLDEKGVWRAAS